MKIRTAFVANSSSSSFVISKSVLSPIQIIAIKDHIEVSKKHGLGLYVMDNLDIDRWEIEETDDEVKGSTILDNFDMHYYLTVIVGIKESDIEWGD